MPAFEVADAFGADDVFGPEACHEVVEHAEVHGAACVVHVGADAVFLGFAVLVVVVVVMMVMVVGVVLFVLVVVVIIIIIVVVVVMVRFFLFFVVFVGGVFAFDGFEPCG